MALTQVGSEGIKDDAVTTDKVANSINASISANSAKDLAALNASSLTSGTVAAARLGTATTQNAGDSSTKIATTAYADTAVSNLVDSSPSALNTLNELAAALGDDASFSTTVTNSIATKMPLAGGTFTGDVIFDNATNAGKDLTWDMSDDSLEFADNTKAVFGDGGDLKIYHNGTDNYIMPSNGKLIINNGSENLAQFISNGACELYYNNVKSLTTNSTGIEVLGAEGASGVIGLSADEADDNADIWRMRGNTDGTFDLQNYASGSYETAIKATGNGAVELYYNNVKQFYTTSEGSRAVGRVEFDGGIRLTDTRQIQFGDPDGGDFKIYHDGHNFVHATNGELKMRAATFKVVNEGNSEIQIKATENAAVELYYDNAKKIETVTGGATITGTCTATAFAGDGSALTGIAGIPTGVICLWSGASNAIPSGWTLCNGSNSTPDLRNRFVVGATDSYSVGATGGATTDNFSDSDTVSLSVSGSGTTAKESISGLATSNSNGTYGQHVCEYVSGHGYYNQTRTHSHSFSFSGSGSDTANIAGTIDTVPPYYALCYIMKT